jgi:hypothetical protein
VVSVADPVPGFGAFLTPWTRDTFFLDPGYQILDPQPIFFETSLRENFWGKSSVTDPHHFDADPDSTHHPDADPVLDPAYHFDADPDPDFYLMRMRIRMRIQVRIMMGVHADPDPDTQLW